MAFNLTKIVHMSERITGIVPLIIHLYIYIFRMDKVVILPMNYAYTGNAYLLSIQSENVL